jgi:hypothetical protein
MVNSLINCFLSFSFIVVVLCYSYYWSSNMTQKQMLLFHHKVLLRNMWMCTVRSFVLLRLDPQCIIFVLFLFFFFFFDMCPHKRGWGFELVTSASWGVVRIIFVLLKNEFASKIIGFCYSQCTRGVNPERVPEYWVKIENRLRVPGFFVLNTRPRTRINRLSGPGGTFFLKKK